MGAVGRGGVVDRRGEGRNWWVDMGSVLVVVVRGCFVREVDGFG